MSTIVEAKSVQTLPDDYLKILNTIISQSHTPILNSNIEQAPKPILKREYITPAFLISWYCKNPNKPNKLIQTYTSINGPISLELVKTVNNLHNSGICEIKTLTCGSYYILPNMAKISGTILPEYIVPANKALWWINKNTRLLWITNLFLYLEKLNNAIIDSHQFCPEKIDSKEKLITYIRIIESLVGRRLIQ